MKPLSKIKVIDLTTNISGPTLTMILADLGAEVIKIEKPTGDEARAMAPKQNGDGVFFQNINRGKKSVVLDLKKATHLEKFYELVKEADVVVENFRNGVAAKLHVEYEQLHAINQSLIYCSLSAYGQNGPKKNDPGYDAIIQAETGLMSITGSEQLARIPVSIIDQGSALWGVIAILSAVMLRKESGEGSYVTTSLYETGAFWSNYQLLSAKLLNENPQKLGTNHGAFAPYGAFPTKDGQVMIGISNDPLFKRFCEALQQMEWLNDENYQSNIQRVKNRGMLNKAIEEITIQYETEQLVTLLENAKVPIAKVKTMLEVLSDEQLIENEMLIDVESEGRSTTVTRLPISISTTDLLPNTPAPTLGQHTTIYVEVDADDTQ